MVNNAAGFVLAGGHSSRMGSDKAFVEFGGTTLLTRALLLARAVSVEVRIVGSKEKFAAYGEVIEDVFAQQGPLAGIHAALRSSNRELNLILAVDMPLVEVRFLQYLLDAAEGQRNAVVTLPRVAGGWQPLCAVYRKAFADLAEPALRQGKNKIDPLFANIETREVDESELKAHAFSAEMFRNLNTPEDLKAV